MSIHMLLLLAVMAITWLYGNHGSLRSPRGKYACVAVITVMLTLFTGLRSWWMGDLIKYYTLFRSCNGSQWASYVFSDFTNIGLRVFFRIIGGLGLPYEVALFLIAALSAGTLGLLVYRYSPAPFWSYVMWIAMGFYLFTYTGLKQTIAMAFLVLAFLAILEDRFKGFLLWTLIGGFFHAPAFIFLMAYPLAKMKFGRNYMLLVVAFVALVFVFRRYLVSFMTDLYYEEREWLDMEGVGGRFRMMVFIMAVSILLRPLRKGDVVYNKTFNIMVIALALQLFSVYSNNFTRLADYYYQFIVLFMPLMLQSGTNRNFVRLVPGQGKRAFSFTASTYLLAACAIAAYSVYYYGGYIQSSWALLKDYCFVWEIDPYAFYGV